MELQWPLMLFTLFVAWSAGTFGTQALLSLKGAARNVQMPALITSVVLLAIGGIAVFFHLEHWERIFNGFGNPTSGITQELIAIVILVVVMVVYFAFLRRGDAEDENVKPSGQSAAHSGESVPRWLAVVALVMSVVLVIVMSHSYNMDSRPAWNTPLLWLAYLGNAALLGPLTCTIIATAKRVSVPSLTQFTFWGSILNAVLSIAYGISIVASASAFTQVGYYWDPTHPNYPIADAASAVNIMSGEAAIAFWVGVVVVGCAVPVVCAILSKRKPTAGYAVAIASLICTVIGALCLRGVFYIAGASVFMYY